MSALTNPDTLTRLLFFCLTSNFHRLFQLWSFLFLHQHHHLSRIQLCLHWAGMFHVAVGERTKNLYPFSSTHRCGLSEMSKHQKHPIEGDQVVHPAKQPPDSRKRGFHPGRAHEPNCFMWSSLPLLPSVPRIAVKLLYTFNYSRAYYQTGCFFLTHWYTPLQPFVATRPR